MICNHIGKPVEKCNTFVKCEYCVLNPNRNDNIDKALKILESMKESDDKINKVIKLIKGN